MLGSLTHISLMDMCYNITPKTWRKTCTSFLESINSKVIVFLSCAHSFLFTPCMVCLIDELCMTVHVTCPQVPLDSAKYWTSHLQSSNHGLYGFGSKALGRHEKNAAKVIIFNHLSSISIGLFRSFPNIK